MNTPPPLRSYWICQGIGWTLYAFVNLFLASMAGQIPTAILLYYIFFSVIGLGVTHLYRFQLIRRGWLNGQAGRLIGVIVLACLFFASIWFGLSLFLIRIIRFFVAFPSYFVLTWQLSIIIFFNLSIILLVWSLLYVGFHFFKNYKQIEIDKWKLEATVKESQLEALKSQMNPHFMFNCLNNIRALILENPQKAREMLTHLSDILRYALNYGKTQTVLIRNEIEIVENYLHLVSIELEDRLQYEILLAPQTENLAIPHLLIQTLVENGIKHGISQLPQGGKIGIFIQIQTTYLFIQIQNTGQLKLANNALEKHQGLGIKNTQERLQLMYGEEANLSLYERDNQVFAEIKIPLHKINPA